MINYTDNKTKQHQGAILGLIIAFIMIFAIGCETVEAYENNYIKNTKYYNDITDGLVLKFDVKASFDPNITSRYSRIFDEYGYPGSDIYNRKPQCNANPALYVVPNLTNGTTLSAGQTYKILLKYLYDYNCNYITKTRWEYLIGHTITQADYLKSYTTTTHFWKSYVPANTILAYFSEYPTLSVSFPQNNAEIAEAFFIQGNYTIPAGSDYNKIVAYIGLGIPYAQYSFYQDITLESGSVNIRISGLPEGDDYRIFFYAVNSTGDNYYFSNNDLNISVVSAIPPELPGTEETPPEFFGVIPGIIFYPGHSNYATSTNLYLNLINTIEPIIITIGDNLTFFSSQFDQDIAKETGQRTGQAILMIRSYSSNLNTFFNDLPVSEFLFFYLMLLIIVVVFRLISKLINLIKP